MIAMGRVLRPRFFFNSAGFGLLLAIHGISVLSEGAARRWTRWGPRLWPAAAAILLIASAWDLRRVYAHPKQDFTSARDLVESLRRPSDCMVAVGEGAYALAYYAPHWTIAPHVRNLAVARCPGAAYVVYTLPRRLRAMRPGLFADLEANYSLIRVFPGTLADGDVYVRRSRD